jgi:hypothetical protein
MHRKYLYYLIVALIAVSCSKKPDEIGLDLIENEGLEVGYDTAVSIVAHAEIDDSLRADETTLNLLGQYFDPVFGLTKASFYTQIRLATSTPDFGDTPQLDSLVLTLAYSGFYGDTTSPVTVKVYELSSTIYKDSTYYSDFSTACKPDPVASLTFTPHPLDSVLVDTVMTAAVLNIRLADDLANRILSAPADSLADNDVFLSFIKGLYLTATSVNAPGQGSILYFNLLSTKTALTLYYNDTSSYAFDINDYCARINQYSHNYFSSTDALFLKQVMLADTLLGSQKLYVQAMGGVKTRLRFPSLHEMFGDRKVVINNARLVLPLSPDEWSGTPPSSLLLYRITSSGGIDVLDDQREGDVYFGGTYNSSRQSYSFRISLYVQSLLAGEPDYGLSLMMTSKAVRADGITLAGTSSSNPDPVRLELVYTYVDQ